MNGYSKAEIDHALKMELDTVKLIEEEILSISNDESMSEEDKTHKIDILTPELNCADSEVKFWCEQVPAK